MLLKKLNAICEDVRNSLTTKKNSIDPSVQHTQPTQSLGNKSYFDTSKDKNTNSQKLDVPTELQINQTTAYDVSFKASKPTEKLMHKTYYGSKKSSTPAPVTKTSSLNTFRTPVTNNKNTVIPAPQKAAPNKSLVNKSYFNDKDKTASVQKVDTPDILKTKFNG